MEEVHRVLRPGGELLVEEIEGNAILVWDRIFHWGHAAAAFSLAGLEAKLYAVGLRVRTRYNLRIVGTYAAVKPLLAA